MSKKDTDTKHTNVAARVGMDVIEAMPALIDTDQAASITGQTPLSIARGCAAGRFKAAKCGRAWRINKAAFLEAVGLA